MDFKRLAKIFPLLASDQPGEITAAVLAIGRLLTVDGKDWHWLTSRLVDGTASNDSDSRNLRIKLEHMDRRVNALQQELQFANVAARTAKEKCNSLAKDIQRLEQLLDDAKRRIIDMKRENELIKQGTGTDLKLYYVRVERLLRWSELKPSDKKQLKWLIKCGYLQSTVTKLHDIEKEKIDLIWERYKEWRVAQVKPSA